MPEKVNSNDQLLFHLLRRRHRSNILLSLRKRQYSSPVHGFQHHSSNLRLVPRRDTRRESSQR